MDNRIFNNLMSSRPAGEKSWTLWMIVAAAHILVIAAIVVITSWPDGDEVIEVFHEPILLEVEPVKFTPLPDAAVKPANPLSAQPVRDAKH
ncbi:MAG: hypothetical protein ACRENP_19920 [Longimicrobiales bacterium]